MSSVCSACAPSVWQYHKSNSALDLMIGELRLKVDGMQKELHAQSKRLEDGARFTDQFHNDLRMAVQVLVCLCRQVLVPGQQHRVHVMYI